MESSISSVSSRISGAPVDGGADFVLGDLSSSLSMRTGLLYLTKEKVVPPPPSSILVTLSLPYTALPALPGSDDWLLLIVVRPSQGESGNGEYCLTHIFIAMSFQL